MKNPRKINIEVFRALCTPFIKFAMSGMNLKNRKDLNTLRTLKTSRKLKSNTFILSVNAINAGIDRIIRIKSSLFQFDLKYLLAPNSLNFTISSIMKSVVIVLSAIIRSNLWFSFGK